MLIVDDRTLAARASVSTAQVSFEYGKRGILQWTTGKLMMKRVDIIADLLTFALVALHSR